jgi:hypothetical protein
VATRRIEVRPQRLYDAAAVGEMAGEAVGRALDEAHAPGEAGRRAGRGHHVQGSPPQRPGEQATAKPHRCHPGERFTDPLGRYVARHDPQVEASRLNRPLKQILGGVAGRR